MHRLRSSDNPPLGPAERSDGDDKTHWGPSPLEATNVWTRLILRLSSVVAPCTSNRAAVLLNEGLDLSYRPLDRASASGIVSQSKR